MLDSSLVVDSSLVGFLAPLFDSADPDCSVLSDYSTDHSSVLAAICSCSSISSEGPPSITGWSMVSFI